MGDELKNILVGYRPSGELHIGHLQSIVLPLQSVSDMHITLMIADIHTRTALRAGRSKAEVDAQVEHDCTHSLSVLGRYLDLNTMTIVRQSDVAREHLDLFWTLSMYAGHAHTFGNPIFMDAVYSEYKQVCAQYKMSVANKQIVMDFIADHPECLWGNIGENLAQELQTLLNMTSQQCAKLCSVLNSRTGLYGLAGYPILMAADIILHGPDYVLIGPDQRAHLKITNDLISKYNALNGTHIAHCAPMIACQSVITGPDGNKMSKSVGNTLSLTNIEHDCTQWISQLPSTCRTLSTPGDESCSAYKFAHVWNLPTDFEPCRTANIGCKQCKAMIISDFVHAHKNMAVNNIPYSIPYLLQTGAERTRKLFAEGL